MQAGVALIDAAADRRNVRAQQRTCNRKSRAGDCPGTEPVFETLENIIPRNGKTEPQAGKSEELADRAEDDEVRKLRRPECEAERRIGITEGLVDDKKPVCCLHPVVRGNQRIGRPDPPIGIVRIDDDGQPMLAPDRGKIVDRIDGKTRRGEGTRIFPIGRRYHGNLVVRHGDPIVLDEARQKLNNRLRAGHGERQDLAAAIVIARCTPRLVGEVPVRQAVPGSRRNVRQGDRARIDARGKIEPVVRPAAEGSGSRGDPATMVDHNYLR